MNSKREFFQILPTNLGAGVFSPEATGLSQLIFELPKIPAIMNGKSLRITGTFQVKVDNTTTPANATNFFSAAPVNDVYIDSRTGVSSCIETISIANLQGTTYSTIKNYNRLMSSIIPLNESTKNYLNGIDTTYGCLGKDVSTAKKCDKVFDFSIPIMDGFLLGQPINMFMTQGLRITITLAPSNYVISNNKWRNNASKAGLTNGGAYYTITNPLCTFEADRPDQAGQEQIESLTEGSMVYNTYSSFYNVLVSTDHNLSLLFNVKRMISLIGNMIPSEWVNNYRYNSGRTLQPVYANSNNVLDNRIQVDSYTYTLGGQRIPLDFEVDSEGTQSEGVADAVKNEVELNAIREGWNAGNFTKSLQTELSLPLSNSEPARFDKSREAIVGEDKVQQYNIGLSYDHITEIGQDATNRPFGLRIQSTLPSGVKLPPHSIFLYVLHQNQIIFKDGAVSVIS